LFTWGPALLGHRLILTGDHQQLGPLSDQTSSLLNRSLFEYCIVKKHIPTYMLKVQYRMHEDIMTWYVILYI
jgi:superfamily I DNA and/or RNA helicase